MNQYDYNSCTYPGEPALSSQTFTSYMNGGYILVSSLSSTSISFYVVPSSTINPETIYLSYYRFYVERLSFPSSCSSSTHPSYPCSASGGTITLSRTSDMSWGGGSGVTFIINFGSSIGNYNRQYSVLYSHMNIEYFVLITSNYDCSCSYPCSCYNTGQYNCGWATRTYYDYYANPSSDY
jgi:hypothetical protein